MKRQMSFYFDMNRCVGCQACEVACQVKNDVQSDISFRKVTSFETERNGKQIERFISVACMHCEEPSCVKVCPVGAYEKRKGDGIVTLDSTKCIGCGYCLYACQYHAISVRKIDKKAVKCDMCVDLLEKNESPACVRGCPLQALKAGYSDGFAAAGALAQTEGFTAHSTKPSIFFAPSKINKDGR